MTRHAVLDHDRDVRQRYCAVTARPNLQDLLCAPKRLGHVCRSTWSARYVGGILVLGKELEVGYMATFVFLSFLAVSSAAQLRALVGRFSDVLVCAARIDALLTKQPATIVPKEGRVLAAFEGRIELLDVHFAYRAREGGAGTAVLAGLTLSIQPGSTTAIVGHTGCGKSTIVALIHRLYDVQRGMVTADGVNVKELQPNWLREQIVVCHQVWCGIQAITRCTATVVFLD